MKNSKLQNLIDRADPRQVSIFGAEHTKEIIKNMSRPIKELRDLVAEKRTELEELQAELLAAEIAENEAANAEEPRCLVCLQQRHIGNERDHAFIAFASEMQIEGTRTGRFISAGENVSFLDRE